MGKIKQETPPCDGCACRDDKIKQLVMVLDDQLGTPCEQIRHEQEIKIYRDALKTVKRVLEAPNTGICDTIWVDYLTTLVDVVDHALLHNESK